MAKSPQKTELAVLFDAVTKAPQRLAKRIAAAGLCSRRDAEQWITSGRVNVDGKKQDSPAINVTNEQVITVDNNPLPMIEPPRLWRYYKPRGLVVSHRDEKYRMTVRNILAEFQEAQAVLEAFSTAENMEKIEKGIAMMHRALANGHKIMSCGNGGSMCDAMHFAEELSGRYRNNRPALAAVSISDPSHLSCVANDYGYDHVFSRYV